MEVNECIYCGSLEDLSNEHILPASLWGNETLIRASCKTCAGITSTIERHVSRDLLLPVRVRLGIRTRRPAETPTEFNLDTTDSSGKKKVLKLRISEHPALAMFPEFEQPRTMVDGEISQGIGFVGMNLIGFGVDMDHLKEDHDIKSLTHTVVFKGNYFPRFLAKWAYCVAIQRYGLDAFAEVYVIPDILGQSDTIGTYVGNDRQIVIGKHNSLAGVHTNETTEGKVVVRLKLFAFTDAPEYLVVVGKLKPR